MDALEPGALLLREVANELAEVGLVLHAQPFCRTMCRPVIADGHTGKARVA
jgi:hypothetical protein